MQSSQGRNFIGQNPIGEDFLQQLQLDNLPQQLLEKQRVQNQQQQYQQNSSSLVNSNFSSQQQKPGYTSKKCNCKQSQCIKLYCECYAAGVYCNGCHCVSCKNNDQSEGWRNQAIQNTLVKNPTAFLPKISQKQEAASKVVDPLNLGKHNKGCACKRSGCMKKYCECFQAGVPCSENCKCTDCQNTGFVSHGNLLRQFREDDSYNSQNQILHKFLLAHNEEHLNSILGENNGGGELGFYKKGIPIKTEFIEESCMKLLQILHLPDEDIFKRRDQLILEKYNKNHNHSNLKEESQIENNSSVKKEDRILKTPPQKSKRPEGTMGEEEGQKSGDHYNKDTSCDIDLACQDENMDEEEEMVQNKYNQLHKQEEPDNSLVKAQNETLLKDSELSSINKDNNESQTESTAVTSSINKSKSFSQKSDSNNNQNLNQEKQKEGDKINSEEQESQMKLEEEKKEMIEEEEQKQKDELNNFKNSEKESEEDERDLLKQKNGISHQESSGNEMDIECHSSALKRKQELYEIRRSFILETFIDLLRNVEQTI
ncbi:hypothetical protein ABPG74_005456 [Tetrahymena malaccensis]